MSATEFRARKLIAVFVLILVGGLAGCAHTNPRDPFESLNRGIYEFNHALDTAILKPVATGYEAVLPEFARIGLSNFFSNLDDITVVINNLLQLKIPQAVSDTGRFLVNTTVGLLGFLDVATHLGLEKHNEDFGQTLGHWGIGSGPYLVLPLLGPSTLRDGLALWVDFAIDPVFRYVDHIPTRNTTVATRFVGRRARVFSAERVVDVAAIDRYAFLRDAYLQRRRSLVHDGNPPPEPDDDEVTEKPRTEAPATPSTILVDRYGNIVAGVAEPVDPVRVAAANPSAAPTRPLVTTASVEAATVAPAIQPADQPQSSPAVQENVASSRIVRVWLSGNSSQ